MTMQSETKSLTYADPDTMVRAAAMGKNIEAVVPCLFAGSGIKLVWTTGRKLLAGAGIAFLWVVAGGLYLGDKYPDKYGFLLTFAMPIVAAIVGLIALVFVIGLVLQAIKTGSIFALLSRSIISGARRKPDAVIFTEASVVILAGVQFDTRQNTHSYSTVHVIPYDSITLCKHNMTGNCPIVLTTKDNRTFSFSFAIEMTKAGVTKYTAVVDSYYKNKVVAYGDLTNLLRNKGVTCA